MTARPPIAPEVAAQLITAAPTRLVKKLDAEPAVAESWVWAGHGDRWTIATDKGETVSLATPDGVVAAVEGVRCTCLLSPRCLHVLAVIARLPAMEAAREAVATGLAPPPPPVLNAVDGDMRRAATNAFEAAAALLAVGAEATGAILRAELLRTVHGGRIAGAHRIAAAGTRVARWLQELHADQPEFSSAGLADDLRELLTAAYLVSTAREVDPMWIGTARREYTHAGHLRLHGVFTEAIVARDGYAGVVTYLTDDRGRMYTRADVAPGELDRAVAAYDAAAAIGDAVLSHRELGRAGLFVSDAAVSNDGRLGAGASVKAARSQAASRWTDDALARLWEPPLADQVERMFAADESPPDRRPAGWDLAFLDGIVEGTRDGAVVLELAGGAGVVRLVAVSSHDRLRYRENLAALGQLGGAAVRVIGRMHRDQPRTLGLLALGPHRPDVLAMSEALVGRANVAFDRLAGAVTSTAQPLAAGPPLVDPLAALRRRVERAARSGVASLPPESASDIEREAQALERRLLPSAAGLLRDLLAAATPPDRTFSGIRRAPDPIPFATAWLRVARFEEAARRAIARDRWLR